MRKAERRELARSGAHGSMQQVWHLIGHYVNNGVDHRLQIQVNDWEQLFGCRRCNVAIELESRDMLFAVCRVLHERNIEFEVVCETARHDWH